MGSIAAANKKPHAVFIPYPTQSHIKALLKLSKLLHHRGFHITFVNTEFNHRRFLKSQGPNSLDGLPDFRFEAIPDGLPLSEEDATQDIILLCQYIRKRAMVAPFLELLTKLNHRATTSNINPPVTCIVSDGLMMYTTEVAEKIGVPDLKFFPFSACGFMGFRHSRTLMEKGIIPLKDEASLTNGFLDTVIDWIPGFEGIRLKDFSSFIRTTNPNETLLDYSSTSTVELEKASALILHTFDALESHVLKAVSSMYPHTYAIGPLQRLLDRVPENSSEKVGYHLWKEDTECLKWLDTKPPNSVLYVNFGSIAVTTPQQLVEFGMGLANSKQNFLWIIRPDLVTGESAILPAELAVETKERGKIASWCPQEQVLNHPSVGGFLTHCGWNSIVESLSAGVPMLCWPFFAEQQTNCRYSCVEWEVGMEIDNDVKRHEVEKLVRELMEGDKGKKMKSKALEWKKLVEHATGPNGSSSINLDRLVNQVLLKNQN
ncbi:7-deoxyloganetin glucosyltransferase-like [Ziziphus jujuba]|uniref:Glycosyltransferase n=1 Tax=Ziziphus jujuba TaxID=326968 RepID=A0ABM4A664_ZIZJJ|nr:7-deoxyloganetin glucosyltransferase-like [Ziziphus jujuba]